jgi:PD-(D/E)XK nuclease superfamily
MDEQQKLILPRLYERDIDVLLQEELIFNQSVCEIFSRALGLQSPLQVTQCALSVVDQTGETDLLARFANGEKQGVLLIENKIDAAFQPTQPERYRARAGEMAQSGEAVYCILIAPKRYAAGNEEAIAHFDACVAYEDVVEAVEAAQTDRAKHRAALLRRAVEQARSSYVVIPAPQVTTMWQRIFEIAEKEFPLLKMKAPTEKGGASWWLIFKGDLPANITIDWKVRQGSVDLSFWNRARHKPTASSPVPPGALLMTSGTTTMFRRALEQPPEQWVDLTDQQIRNALNVAYGMLEFYHSSADTFQATAGVAPS